MLKSRRLWLGLAVSLVFVFLFLVTVDIGDVADALTDAKYQYLAPAVMLYFLAVFFRTLRWRYLLSPVRKVGVSRLFPVVTVGYMANNLLPARLGEVARAYYLRQREGLSTSTGLATIVVERVYDGLTLLFLAAVAVPFLIFSGLVDDAGTTSAVSWAILGVVAALVFIAAITVLTLVAINPRFGAFIERLANLLPAKLRPKARELIGLFIQGLSVLREPRRHPGLFLLSLPVWLLEGSMYLMIALSFDLLDFFSPAILIIPVILLVTAASNLATSIPSSPGSVGTFEFPAAAALTLVGVGAGVAGAFALLVHVALLVPVTVLGLLYLWFEHIPLSRLIGREEGAPSTYPVADSGLVAQEREEQ